MRFCGIEVLFGGGFAKMESSLNAAHLQHRKAQNCIRRGKFDEAVSHHQKAADLLKDAMQITKSEKALESLKLQHDYHIRQEAITKFKQQQAEKLRKTLQKKKLSETDRGDSEQTVAPGTDSSAEELQSAIYKTMEENDSLLQFLLEHKGEREGNETEDEIVSQVSENPAMSWKKAPKGDKDIMEELRTNNEELRYLVQQLVGELERCQEQKQRMQEFIDNNLQCLQASQASSSRMTIQQDQQKLKESQQDETQKEKEQKELKDTEPQSQQNETHSELTSPYDSSQGSDLSPVDLPPLAPLEMPDLGFMFKSEKDP